MKQVSEQETSAGLGEAERMKEYVRMAVWKNVRWIVGAVKTKLLIMNIKLLIKIPGLILMILMLVNMDVYPRGLQIPIK